MLRRKERSHEFMVRDASPFTRFASATARWSGRPLIFTLAIAMIVTWIITGPVFGFSDTWQLVMNTVTSIITFLMVFLIQNTQYRDTYAIQIKLDELIRVTEGAHLSLLELEELSQQELEDICQRYGEIAHEARKLLRAGKDDTHAKEVKLGEGDGK